MKVLNKKNIITLVLILVFYSVIQGLISARVINSFYEITIATICINIILAVSLNLVTGFTGQFSLGHAGFMSIGAYAGALTVMNTNSTMGFLAGVLIGAIAAAFVGIIIGIPTLRLKGDYLAIATLGMAEIIRVVFLNMNDITNGAAGLNGIPRYANWLWLFVFTAVTLILINNFIKSSLGRACISIREDEIAAESMGINTTKYKVMAFSIGAFFAGIAGALYSSYFYFIKPDLFGFMKSIDILVIVVFGGMGSITGSIIAAIVLAVVTTFLQSFAALRMIFYALLLIIIMIFRPQGLLGTKEITDLFKFKKKSEKIE
ncbi:MAG: branched-chain amino acid ABC transporter permease [Tissierellia bacterium]|nr:branched-chain amino acid ABC transporter permease [Tissierellia bacterium]MDD4781068.1 branched-chain amino acid ABC transporter permease [Tissierellia bacterium]